MKSFNHLVALTAAGVMTLASGLPAGAREAPVEIPTTSVTQRIELVAVADADVQGGAPDVNYGDDSLMHIGNEDKTVFVRFDLSALPPHARIKKARLLMTVAGSGTDANEVVLGVPRDDWDESEVTFANQPEVTLSERTRDITGPGVLRWGVKGPVAKWLHGTQPNNGFAVRSTGPGAIWAFRSREAVQADERPRLRIEYEETRGVLEAPTARR